MVGISDSNVRYTYNTVRVGISDSNGSRYIRH